MGVRQAMDLALEIAFEEDGPIYTYGPLIHNPSALELLREKGVDVLKEIPEKGTGTVIIRAHGITPRDGAALRSAGFHVVDGTCPRVIKVQSLASHYARKGHTVLVIGDKGHPEVKGILGHAGGRGVLVSSEKDLESLDIEGPYILVAQTTQDRERYEAWCREILKRFPGGRVFDTICDSTKRRQQEVRRLSREVDAFIVVGGKKSANTRRLAEIAEEEGKKVFFVETEADIDEEALREFSCVGVTAGASTPNWVINGVIRRVEAIPGRGESLQSRALWRTLRFLHESNLWTGLAGAALGVGASMVLANGMWHGPFIAFFIVFAMHTLSRLTDERSGRFNDPLRTSFLLRHKRLFKLASYSGIASAMILAWMLGWTGFFLLLLIVISGMVYSLTPLKELPGSKTLFIAGAWTTAAVLVPCRELLLTPACLMVAAFSFLLVVLRDVLMEIIDVQGDRLVGRETLTILMGEDRILRLASIFTLASALCALVIPFMVPGITKAFWAYSAAFIYGFLLIKAFKRERLGRNLKLELLVEAITMVFMVAGLLEKISSFFVALYLVF